MFAVKSKILTSDHRNQKKNLLTIATILLLPFYKCLRLKIIFQDRRGKMFCHSNVKSKQITTTNQLLRPLTSLLRSKKKEKKTKKQKLKEQWFLEEEAKNHCELIAALM